MVVVCGDRPFRQTLALCDYLQRRRRRICRTITPARTLAFPTGMPALILLTCTPPKAWGRRQVDPDYECASFGLQHKSPAGSRIFAHAKFRRPAGDLLELQPTSEKQTLAEPELVRARLALLREPSCP